jgi:hypothetical protein
MMTKATGVAEAMLFEGLSKDKVTAIERECASSVQTSPVQLATLARLLELALGRNLACDALPPFALVQAVEAIGLDDLIPNLATPADIIAIELAGSSDCDGSEAIREAHERVAHSELAINWFEAGDRVDAILTTAGSVAAGERALLEGYLPDRRAFWAAQCARSALALRDRG